MPENEAVLQPIPSKKRRRTKKIRRKRNHNKKNKNSENVEFEEETLINEDDSDSLLEDTAVDQTIVESIEDWPLTMLTTADQLEMREMATYKTGTKVDELFPGGIKCQEIIELCGQHQCGKTKIATTIAISLLLNYKEKHAIYLYSNNDFHVCNVRSIIMSRGLQEDVVKEVLSRLRLIPIDETEDLLSALREISDPDEIDSYSFVFIDSITVPFYHAKTLDADLSSEMISKVHEFLFKLAKIHDKTIFLTNLALNACSHQDYSDEEDEGTVRSSSNDSPHELKVKHDGSESEAFNSKADFIKPALGNHWSEILDHRFIISSVDLEDSENEDLAFLDANRKVTCLKMNEDHNDPAKAIVIKLGDIGAVYK